MSDVASWILSSAEAAAFTSGPDGSVTGWNTAAEKLLGASARDVLGAPCHEVVSGRDPYGNRYCGPQCPIRRMAHGSEPIHRFRLDVGEATTAPLPIWVLVVVVGGRPSHGPSLIHLLEPVILARPSPPGAAETSATDEGWSVPQGLLSPDETSLLGLVGNQVSIDVVADVLGVGPDRARSVLLGCLRKLEALVSPGENRLAERLSPFHRRHVM